MKKIELDNITTSNNRIEYVFHTDSELLRYFDMEKKYSIEYFFDGIEIDINDVPYSILAIPFVCNVLPIVWLTDAELILPELDEDFYYSVPDFKQGYIDMYPDAVFAGKMTVRSIKKNKGKNSEGSATFFSGGLDATTTFLRHLEEKPDLISVWGSDVGFYNIDGWKPIQKAIDDVATEYKVNHISIHSSFRLFDKERELDRVYSGILHDGWWHGVKHGIGLLGHAAPIVWLSGKRIIYIASSNCPTDGKVTCASNPTIDNYVRFCGARIVHDGFELSRQEKTSYVVEHYKANPSIPIKLHVCWESEDGNNCCHCEKCYRTIVSIWAEGGDPRDFGFDVDEKVLKAIYHKMALEYNYSNIIAIQWNQIKQGIRKNALWLKSKPYYRDIKWIVNFDFFSPENNLCRKYNRLVKTKSFRGKLSQFKFYQALHRMKQEIFDLLL